MTPVEHSDPHLARIAREETAYLARVRPKMRRGRRVMILGGMFLVLILGVLGFRQVWLARAEARLQTRIDAIHARGEPILIEDFTYPDIADEDNAAKDYDAAAALLVNAVPPVDPGSDGDPLAAQNRATSFDIFEAARDSEFRRTYDSTIRQFVWDNRPALDRFRAARSKRGSDFGFRISTPVGNPGVVKLSSCRQLAKTANVVAAVATDNGDYGNAVAIAHDLTLLSDRISNGQSTLLGRLVAATIEAMAAGTVEQTAFAITVSDEAVGDSGSRQLQSPSRFDVLNLIGALLDETAVYEGWIRSALGVRTEVLASANQPVLAGTGMPRSAATSAVEQARNWILHPLIVYVNCEAVDQCTRFLEASRAHNAPTARRVGRLDEGQADWGPWIDLAPWGVRLGQSLERSVEHHFRGLAMRRMAALALAIRMFELDHGHRPDSLEELIPDYLLALPKDPFASDDRAFGYLPDADHPRLYSVNVNGIDDSGSYFQRSSGSINYECCDHPFFLNGRPAFNKQETP